MKQLISWGVGWGVVGILAAPPVGALTLSLNPVTLNVAAGQPFLVDVLVFDLVTGGPPSVGAFDLGVAFDPSLLVPTGVTFGPFLGDPNQLEVLTTFNLLPATIDLAAVSLLSPTELDALQAASFRLASLSFQGLATGTTALSFSRVSVDDSFGNDITVPEPATILLIGSGLAAMVRSRRMRPR